MTGDGPTWVVGAGGLLGGAVQRRLVADGRPALTSVVPWEDTAGAVDSLRSGLAAVTALADGGPWSIVWCAGSGVTSTTTATLDAELDLLRTFVDTALAHAAQELPRATVFLASSAGGIYAGAANPPFTERTTPAPLAAYGAAKLRAEAEMSRLAADGGARLLVGRISNLYGPGQNLAKAQGLISQMCRAHMLAQPIGVYVSMDTIRDYLFVDDAAGLVVDGLAMLRTRALPGEVVVKILAAQRSVSIAAVLGEFRTIFKRRLLVRLAASQHARQQARDLRFRSTVWPELDRRSLMTLAAGIQATSADIAARVRQGEMSELGRG
ncbi:hypothetical protein AGMMS50218_11620 [Actinomycetota bacterium]|nr:hypothetical protein AGMMS50218_11620 [Actinomycetota bacterium]